MNQFVRSIAESTRAISASTPLRRLAAALVLAEVSAPVYYTATGVWMFREGGSMLAALYGVVSLVPAAAAAPFATVVADRLPRSAVLRHSLGLRAVLLLLLAGGIAVGSVPLVLASACLASLCARIFYPAVAASLPRLTRTRAELVSANAVVSGTEHVGSVLGPALAGASLVVVSPAAICAAAALGTLGAAVALGRVAVPSPARAPGESDDAASGRALTAGFVALGSATTRRLVLVHGAHCLAFGALSVALVQLALETLRSGTAGLGLLEAALAVGGITGSAVALGGLARHGTARTVRLGAALWATPLCLVAALAAPFAAVACLAVTGVGNLLLDVAVYTHVQETTEERVLARTVAALQSVAVAAVGIGSLLAGVGLSTVGTGGTLLAIGVAVPLAIIGLQRAPAADERPRTAVVAA